jgi:mannosyltransferase
MKLSPKYTLVVLIIILLLGAGLRVYHLGTEDLWYDEVCTITYSQVPWSQINYEPEDFPHYLFNHFVMFFWLKLNQTALFARLFSALVGIISIYLIYLFGRYLLNSTVGLLGALFLSLSSYHIYYSQELRAYALQLFLILLMVYIFYRTEEKDMPGLRFIYICITVFTIYLQAFTIFIWLTLAGYSLHNIWHKNEALKMEEWLVTQCIIAVCFIFFLVYLTRPDIQAYSNWIPKPTLLDIKNMFELFGIGWLCWLLPKFLRWSIFSISICLLLLSIFKIERSDRYNTVKVDQSQGLRFIWYLFAFPLMFFLIVSIKKPIFVPYRYPIIILPFFYLLIAYGIYKIKYSRLQSIVVIVLIIGMILGIQKYYSEPKKISWSQIAQYLDQNNKSGDWVFLYQHYWERPLKYYLKSDMQIKAIDLSRETVSQIFSGVHNHPRIWLITVLSENQQLPREIINTTKKSIRL